MCKPNTQECETCKIYIGDPVGCPGRTPNARFWTWIHDGWVKITLRPGQTLRHHYAAPHEEGWSSWSETWEYDGAEVDNHWQSDGTDCDGRLTRTGHRVCALGALRAEQATEKTISFPGWQTITHDQYDQFAQAAGY